MDHRHRHDDFLALHDHDHDVAAAFVPSRRLLRSIAGSMRRRGAPPEATQLLWNLHPIGVNGSPRTGSGPLGDLPPDLVFPVLSHVLAVDHISQYPTDAPDYETIVIERARGKLATFLRLALVSPTYRDILFTPRFRNTVYRQWFEATAGPVGATYPVPAPYYIDAENRALGRQWYKHLVYSALLAGYLRRITHAAGRIVTGRSPPLPGLGHSDIMGFLESTYNTLFEDTTPESLRVAITLDQVSVRDIPHRQQEQAPAYPGPNQALYSFIRNRGGFMTAIPEMLVNHEFQLIVHMTEPMFPGSKYLDWLFSETYDVDRDRPPRTWYQRTGDIPSLEYYAVIRRTLIQPALGIQIEPNSIMGADVIRLWIGHPDPRSVFPVARPTNLSPGTVTIAARDHLLIVDEERTPNRITPATLTMAPIPIPALRNGLRFFLNNVKVADNPPFRRWLEYLLPYAYVDLLRTSRNNMPGSKITLDDVYIRFQLDQRGNPLHRLDIEGAIYAPVLAAHQRARELNRVRTLDVAGAPWSPDIIMSEYRHVQRATTDHSYHTVPIPRIPSPVWALLKKLTVNHIKWP